MTGEPPGVESVPLPPCAWCGDASVTEVVIVSGTKNRKTSWVCESHAEHFERQGVDTTRSIVDKKMEAERKRKTWAREHLR